MKRKKQAKKEKETKENMERNVNRQLATGPEPRPSRNNMDVATPVCPVSAVAEHPPMLPNRPVAPNAFRPPNLALECVCYLLCHMRAFFTLQLRHHTPCNPPKP